MNGLNKLTYGLRTDALIKLHIGKDQSSNPYLVQESLLGAFLDLPNSVETENDHPAIRLPEDDPDAWKLLLCYLFRKNISQALQNNLLLAVKAWILGDKYNIPLFQDSIMLQLLNAVEKNLEPLITDEMILEAAKREPREHVLRDFLVEQAVMQVTESAWENEKDKLERMESLDHLGFSSVFAEERAKWEDVGRRGPCVRFGRGQNGTWRDFMVGPSQKYEQGQYRPKEI